MKPALAFVNFFREKRGRRVVEVKDIQPPEDAADNWPSHHKDFQEKTVYGVQWPHLPVEGSFSTSDIYDAHILCFGVTMEDLLHEAKQTGHKIPPGDIEKYKDVGLKVTKANSPCVKKSSKGRKLKETDRLTQDLTAPQQKKKKKILEEPVSKSVKCVKDSDVPFPDIEDEEDDESSLLAENIPSSHSRRKKKPTLEDLTRRSRNEDFLNHMDRKEKSFDKSKSPQKAIGRQSSSKSPQKAIGRQSSSKSPQKAIGRQSSSKSPQKAIGRQSSSNKLDAKKTSGKKVMTPDKSLKRQTISPLSTLSPKKPVPKSSDFDSTNSLNFDSGPHESKSPQKAVVRQSLSHKLDTKKPGGMKVMTPDKSLKRPSVSPLSTLSPKKPVPMKSSKFNSPSFNYDSGAAHKSDIHSDYDSSSSVKSCSFQPSHDNFLSYDGTEMDFKDTRILKPKRNHPKKNIIEDTTTDDDCSYVSSQDATNVQLNLYLNKIAKLEAEVKALRKEKNEKLFGSPSPSESGSSNNSGSKSQVSKQLFTQASFSQKTNSPRTPEKKSDYVDNEAISNMIVDALKDEAPLRRDGSGKVHLGNGVWVSASLFEKIRSSKVSPSIAVRDTMGHIYTNQEMAQRSLEGGTPVKGGPDRKKLKKLPMTPAKKECLLGVYRAKQILQTGSTDQHFLKLCVEKGKGTIRDKLKESVAKQNRAK